MTLLQDANTDHGRDATLDNALFRPNSELYALQQISEKGEQSKLRDASIRKEGTLIRFTERVGGYAEPLSPLRERDLQALASLFQRKEMYAIEADINQILLHLLPEPCWEEENFLDLLHDLL